MSDSREIDLRDDEGEHVAADDDDHTVVASDAALQRLDAAATGDASSRKPAADTAAAVDGSDDLTGRTLDDFRVLRTLGQGGMARVYLAEQQSLRRQVALKVMSPEMLAKSDAIDRFRREAMAAANLSHGNIVQVFTVGQVDSQHYIAMEYVAGRNLRQWVRRAGPMPLPQALKVMRQAASALKAAGAAGIVHRDIKPANLMISRRGVVKVADFGLSLAPNSGQSGEITEVGQTVGTPRYMSPEQVEGRPTDHRSDLYSLGVTFYYLLAGQAPYDGGTPVQIALQHIKSTPPPLASMRPDLPPELCELVHRMMSKSPADRPADAGEVADVLKRLSRLYAAESDDDITVTGGDPTEVSGSLVRLTASTRKSLVKLLGSRAAAVRSPKYLLLPLLALFGFGLLVGVAMRPVDPLRGPLDPHPKAATAEAQYVDAMLDATPEAFAAVERHWTGSEYADLAVKQRLLLLVKDPRRTDDALTLADTLARRPDAVRFAEVVIAARAVLSAGSRDDDARLELTKLDADDVARLPGGWQAAVDEARRRVFRGGRPR